MNTLQPEKRRVKLTSGTLPAFKIASLAVCHPFSQQLDIVFPSDPSLLAALEALKSSYGTGKARLSDIMNNAHIFVDFGEAKSRILATSVNPHQEDVWSIDPRGHLTLSVTKETYERLGLVGRKLPYRNHNERFVIDLPLQKTNQFAAKQKISLELWDKMREAELGKDAGMWDVVYCSEDRDISPHMLPFQMCELKSVQCKKTELRDVYVPVPSCSSRPEKSAKMKKPNLSAVEQDEGNLEDWNGHVESLVEWVGMACIGAQRLYANDRVDPYVAVYEHPTPSHIQNVTHLQWRGLLSPSFVEEMLDTVITALQNPSSTLSFIGVTCHALTTSPVSYIPYTATKAGVAQNPNSVPLRLPRADGEDAWCLVLEGPCQNDDGSGLVQWCLTESIGQWDSRWG